MVHILYVNKLHEVFYRHYLHILLSLVTHLNITINIFSFIKSFLSIKFAGKKIFGYPDNIVLKNTMDL